MQIDMQSLAKHMILMQYAYNVAKLIESERTGHIDVRCLVRCMSGDFAVMSCEPVAVRTGVRCVVLWKLCALVENMQHTSSAHAKSRMGAV